MSNFENQRQRMVQRQIAARGIHDARVLRALRRVPRERFVAEDLARAAYDDAPLPIGEGQTISQPYIVAFTAEALRLDGSERLLEVGAGSGYAAAVFSLLAREVFAVERVESLCESASSRLEALGYHNVHIKCGDGSLGWPEQAPFQAISVAAVGPEVPAALLAQLDIGGRLIMPVGPDGTQTLMRVVRKGEDRYEREALVDVRFVPLIGAQGFKGTSQAARR